MTTLISATEAARRLGVRPATLYAYVSRGRIQRVLGVDGRRSLFDVDEVDRLAGQGRHAGTKSSLVPVQIDTSITELGESMLRFRGHDASALARSASFEQVAELLWTGRLSDDVPRWAHPEPIYLDVRAAAAAVGGSVFSRLSAGLLAAGRTIEGGDTLASARLLLAAAPSALGAPLTGPMARRVARIWIDAPDRRTISAVERVLVLLADHELATCTLAARLAASTRTELSGCLVAGLSALSGPLHGGASKAVHELLTEAETQPIAQLVAGFRSRRQPVPGFGHKVYKSGDPRFPPILESARSLGDQRRVAHVDRVFSALSERLPVAANVDAALGALSYLADLPTDAPAVMFAIARLAGITAHVLEEYEATPVRFRTTAHFVEASPVGDRLPDVDRLDDRPGRSELMG
jgi:citrate synthase